MEENSNILDKYITREKDYYGNTWYTINGLTDFIVSSFDAPSFYEVDQIKEEIGAQEGKYISSGYGFKTKEEALEGLEKLIDKAEKGGTPCYKNGHILDMESIKEFKTFGTCEICRSILGYVCTKNSPSILCEYDEENDPCLDNCIHCGYPAERK